MAQSLASLIRSGNAQSFHLAVQQLVEDEEPMPSLENESFRDLSLTGFDFDGFDFSNAEFEGCTLTDVNFENCTLDGAYFHGTTLLSSRIVENQTDGFAIDSCTLSQCEIRGLTLDNCEWNDCQFTDCNMTQIRGEDMAFDRLTFKGGSWQDVKLDSGEFQYVTLRSMGLTDCVLDEVSAKNCYLVEVQLTETKLPAEFREKTGRRQTF